MTESKLLKEASKFAKSLASLSEQERLVFQGIVIGMKLSKKPQAS